MTTAAEAMEELPPEEREVEETEEEGDDEWNEEWEIYYDEHGTGEETPGETFGSPMTTGSEKRLLVTRDLARVKERILFYVLDGFTPDAGQESRDLFDKMTVVENDRKK